MDMNDIVEREETNIPDHCPDKIPYLSQKITVTMGADPNAMITLPH